MMFRILVIGEKPEDAKALAFRLGLHGFEAAPSAGDVTLVLRSLFSVKPDALVLDAGGAPGSRELFRLLERVAPIPIFVMGDAREAEELVWYLEKGAADYLTKPVGAKLLCARLNAVLRRLNESGQGAISVGDLAIDLDRHQVRKNSDVVQLTPTEFRLLQVLAEHAGRALSHELLLEKVWGEDFKHCSHYLRLYIGYLRHKLEEDPGNPRLLLTEWGVGYRLATEHTEATSRTPRPAKAAAAWA